MQRRVTGPVNGGEALGNDLKVGGELVKWTQQWVGTSFRTGPEMKQAFSTDKGKKCIYAYISRFTAH
jgi:hypothetical protein